MVRQALPSHLPPSEILYRLWNEAGRRDILGQRRYRWCTVHSPSTRHSLLTLPMKVEAFFKSTSSRKSPRRLRMESILCFNSIPSFAGTIRTSSPSFKPNLSLKSFGIVTWPLEVIFDWYDNDSNRLTDCKPTRD